MEDSDIQTNLTTPHEQLNNLLTFTLMFHRVCRESYFMNCDGSYIMEKYNKMIGIKPKIFVDSLNPKIDEYKKEWMERWGYTKIHSELESVINYFCLINSKPVTLKLIIDSFQLYIGCANDICDFEYTHIHPKLKNFIEEYKLKFRREINLEML